MFVKTLLILAVFSATVQSQRNQPPTPSKIFLNFLGKIFIEFSAVRCLMSHSEDFDECNDIIYQYRYDAATKLCVLFDYDGCGGSLNRFPTMRECVKVCGAKNSLRPPGKFCVLTLTLFSSINETFRSMSYE